jgi:hypothetical protein
MTTIQKPTLVVQEFNTPEEIEEALSRLADRCNALPPHKQGFLAHTIRNNHLDLEVIALLVLMLENSDDDFKITSPELNKLISEAQAAVTGKEAP